VSPPFPPIQPLATISIGPNPSGIAVTPDGRRAYVATEPNTLEIIDLDNAAAVGNVPFPGSPFAVAITPDGNRGLTTLTSNGTVEVFELASITTATSIPVDHFPMGIAVTPDSKQAYVVCSGSSSIRVIDLATNNISPPTPPEGDPAWIAIAPNGQHAYVINGSAGLVSILDTTTGAKVGHEIVVGGDPLGGAITPDGQHLLVVNTEASFGDQSTLSVITTETNTAGLPLLGIGQRARTIAISPDGIRAYITSRPNPNAGVISVYAIQEILAKVSPT
jgi:YVTN family beta-propeller protein